MARIGLKAPRPGRPDSMDRGAVICIGECMIELSESPAGGLSRAFGGDTLNTALYLTRLGVTTEYVTALGDDPFSDEMVAAWTREGIGTRLVARLPGALPGLYLIQTNASGERSFHYWRDSAPVRRLFETPGIETIETALCQAGTIYLSGITLSLFDGDRRQRLFRALARARDCGAQIAFDTNFRPRGWPDRAAAQAAYAQAFAASDLVLASTEDHTLLHGPAEPDAILRHIQAAGVPEIVLKLNTPSCLVATPAGSDTVDAAPVADVIDTTAAGDSFAAAYVAARRAGYAPVDAARAGHRLAGIVVQHPGAVAPRSATAHLSIPQPR